MNIEKGDIVGKSGKRVLYNIHSIKDGSVFFAKFVANPFEAMQMEEGDFKRMMADEEATIFREVEG